MRWPKKADRAGLHPGRAAWALGLVRGRSRAVPGGAAFWCVVAAARATGDAAARIHPRRHDQDPDPVPSRYRPGAAAISRSRHQCGPAPVVARAPERDPAELPPPVPRSGGPRCGPPSASRLDTFGMVLPTLSGCKPSRALRPRKPDGRGVTVVGDDAQSIYSFRAAEHAIASRCRLATAETPALTLWHCAGREREIV